MLLHYMLGVLITLSDQAFVELCRQRTGWLAG